MFTYIGLNLVYIYLFYGRSSHCSEAVQASCQGNIMKLGLDLSHSFTQRYIAEGEGKRLFIRRASVLFSACSNEAVDCFTGKT